MRRAVIRLLEDTFSEEFLSEKIKEDDTAVVDVNDQGKVYEAPDRVILSLHALLLQKYKY
jgi:ATP-dependent Clp protease ATP-binding subunit ClpC